MDLYFRAVRNLCGPMPERTAFSLTLAEIHLNYLVPAILNG